MGSLPSLSPQRTEEAPRAPVRGFFSSGLVDAGALATATGCASDAQLILSMPGNFQLVRFRKPRSGLFTGHYPSVRFGSLADILTSQRHVRFTPNNGRWAAHPSQHLAVGLCVHALVHR